MLFTVLVLYKVEAADIHILQATCIIAQTEEKKEKELRLHV